jgi:hypothetical protein
MHLASEVRDAVFDLPARVAKDRKDGALGLVNDDIAISETDDLRPAAFSGTVLRRLPEPPTGPEGDEGFPAGDVIEFNGLTGVGGVGELQAEQLSVVFRLLEAVASSSLGALASTMARGELRSKQSRKSTRLGSLRIKLLPAGTILLPAMLRGSAIKCGLSS